MLRFVAVFLISVLSFAVDGEESQHEPLDLSAYLEQPGIRSKIEAGNVAAFEANADDAPIVFTNVFDGTSTERKGETLFLFLTERPLERVWSVITDVLTHPEFLPKLKSAEYMNERDGKQRTHYEFRSPIGIVDQYVFVKQWDEAHVLALTLDTEEEQVLIRSNTFWHARPYDDGSERVLVAYYQDVLPKGLIRQTFYNPMAESLPFAEAMQGYLKGLPEGSVEVE